MITDITEQSAWPVIAFPSGPRGRAREIIRDAAKRHGVTAESLVGPRRPLAVIAARREAAWQIAKETDLSFPAIGVILGKDHSSIIWAVRRQNEITGENVRGLGGVPKKALERKRASASRVRQPMTRADRLRRSRLRASVNEVLA